VPDSSRPRSVFQKVRNRFRYGLATQELLDRLSATFGLIICPYYVVHEKIQSGIEPEIARDNSHYRVRYLTEDDMTFVAKHAAQTRSTEDLVKKLRNRCHCLGFFVNGDLAAYTWFRFDRVATPIWQIDLFRLEGDEAYLFDAYVLPEYRGRRLAPLIRYRAYQELKNVGRRRLYSLTLAFNASSRRFKQRLLGKETELRLMIGIKKWKALDIRLRAFDKSRRSPRWMSLTQHREQAPSGDA